MKLLILTELRQLRTTSIILISLWQYESQIFDSLIFSQKFSFALSYVFLHQFNCFEVLPVLSLFSLQLRCQLYNQIFSFLVHRLLELVFQLMVFVFHVGNFPDELQISSLSLSKQFLWFFERNLKSGNVIFFSLELLLQITWLLGLKNVSIFQKLTVVLYLCFWCGGFF